DGRPCRVRCDFCYLGARAPAAERTLDPSVIAAIVAAAPARDVAVAVNEPARRWRPGLEAVVTAARARGLPGAGTATPPRAAHRRRRRRGSLGARRRRPAQRLD